MTLARDLLDLLVPPTCPGCGVRRSDGRFCFGCLAEVVRPCRPVCPTCGLPGKAAVLCSACRAGRPFRRARAYAVHHGPVAGWIARLKYRGEPSLARALGELAAEAAAKHFAPHTHDVVVPVPSSPARLRRRGYNQSVLLADEVSVVLDAEVVCALRRRNARAQVGLRRVERRENVLGVFRVVVPIAGLTVLLVDDVLTTGATAEACAEALLGAGAAAVDVLTLARAPMG